MICKSKAQRIRDSSKDANLDEGIKRRKLGNGKSFVIGLTEKLEAEASKLKKLVTPEKQLVVTPRRSEAKKIVKKIETRTSTNTTSSPISTNLRASARASAVKGREAARKQQEQEGI